MPTGFSRRGLLRTLGAAAVASTAGCASLDDGSDRGAPAPTVAAAQQRPEAEGSAFTDVYSDAIDSVALLRTYGGTDGQGSAWVYRDDYLVTNHHVVDGATTVDVQYADNDWTGAEVVATDPHTDLGVVEVDDRPDYASELSLADERPVVGQEVMALGNPLGFDSSVSTGVISGTNRSIRAPTGYSIPNAIQTDAPLNPGNSGGPLVDLDGEVVGVANSGGGDNLGFGISAAVTELVVPTLIEHGGIQHSRMGVRTLPVDRRLAMANGLEEVRGVFVAEVVDGGPADAVLRGQTGTETVGPTTAPVGGDVIVALDGEPIRTHEQLSSFLLLRTSPDQTIAVSAIRDGEERTVDLTLGTRDA